MLKTVMKYIGQLKTAEQRLIVLLLTSAVVVLFGLLVTNIRGTSKEDKQRITQLENRYDKDMKALQKKLDDCEDQKFNDKLNRIIELEQYGKKQDSIITALTKIK